MNAICVFTNNIHKNTSGYVEFKETNRGLQIKISISGISPENTDFIFMNMVIYGRLFFTLFPFQPN